MTDPVRQTIMEKIEARFKTILTTGGYLTNVGAHVFLWRTTPLDADEMPGLVVSDKVEEIESFTMLQYTHNMVVEVEAVAEPGTVDGELMRDVIMDIFKAVGTEDRWDGYALDTVPLGSEIFQEQEGKIVSGAKVRLLVQYQTSKWGC